MGIDIGTIQSPTVRELFTQRLAGLIINGELNPGERLPSERELAAQANISKSAVHLALVDLERMGFVETKERQGTYVADFTSRGNITILEQLTPANGFEYDSQKIIDILEMRDGLECRALERLAENLTEENIARLAKDVEDAKTYVASTDKVDVHKLAMMYFDFHHDICICSGNFVLPLLFNTFRNSTTYFWEQPVRVLGVARSMEFMKGMYESILTGDAEESKRFFRSEMQYYKDLLQK